MSGIKHTPGPWVVDNSHIGGSINNLEAGRHIALTSVHETKHSDREENQANARLIAAAPDLLAALQRVMSWIDNWSPDFTYDDEWPADRDLARAAIAKATA